MNSNTGKRLMAKCRMLYQENEDLGKMITSGRLAKLESDLALQKSLTEEMKKAQSGEYDEFIYQYFQFQFIFPKRQFSCLITKCFLCNDYSHRNGRLGSRT